MYLLAKWSTPLADSTEEKFNAPTFKLNLDVDYFIEVMLEHAVVHPIRHEFQLKYIIEA